MLRLSISYGQSRTVVRRHVYSQFRKKDNSTLGVNPGNAPRLRGDTPVTTYSTSTHLTRDKSTMTPNDQNSHKASKRAKLAPSADTRNTSQPDAPPAIFCSVEGCPHKHSGFSKRPVWYHHMMEEHTPWPDGRYHCPFENCKCHKSGFRYRVHFRHHMDWHICHMDMLSHTKDDDIKDTLKASDELDDLLQRTESEWRLVDLERMRAETGWPDFQSQTRVGGLPGNGSSPESYQSI